MEKNLKLSILSIEEERVNFLACVFGCAVSIFALIVVVGFLDGGARDFIVLLLMGGISADSFSGKKGREVRTLRKVCIYDISYLGSMCIGN